MSDYYTLFAFDRSVNTWFDVFGSFDKSEAKEEAETLFWDDFDIKRQHLVIKKHAGTVESLQAILRTLNTL